MPDNWAAVGDAITKGLAAAGMQQKELAAKSGVSVATIREIQRGVPRRRNPRILPALSRGLGKHDGYLANVAQGRDPNEQPHETGARLDDPTAFLARLVSVVEHRLGRIVDVIYENDSDVDITIEIKHSSQDVSPVPHGSPGPGPQQPA